MMELEYKIVRSPKRKKLTITVERDRTVIVHAPERNIRRRVQRVVDAKRQWIFAKLHHPQKYQERRTSARQGGGEWRICPLPRRDYRIEVTETASGEIEFSRYFMVPAARQDKAP